ncbi:31_t:CDS:2 [Ambispora leptoticha]|uniref:Protoporphyrinogen oxidase n=1 Tax=Ambispora leptoticha TaxID=144679 RepID=A0A9N9ALT4_9GLOM|nr:31_t:CDS:2 [Ambispora leptoticha]
MPSLPPKHYAVLGGGISGLTTAWYLMRGAPPETKITLIEAANKLGGWIQTTRVGEEQVLFEQGPRTLRPSGLSGLATLDMIIQLKLTSSFLGISSSHSASKKRYIYYPDKLNELPSSFFGALTSLFTLPVLKGIIPGLLREPFVPKRKLHDNDKDFDDESIHSFVSRRINSHIADNMISALIHGIYAGDVTKLSVRSTFPLLYYSERKYGSLLKAMLVKSNKKNNDNIIPISHQDQILQRTLVEQNKELLKSVQGISMYSFRDGVEELVSAIESELAASEKVEIIRGQAVKNLSFEDEIQTIQGKRIDGIDHVISTIPSFELKKILYHSKSPSLPHLDYNPAVTVAVVNLAYDRPKILPVIGFGYLIPQTTPNNLNYGLGVVFDSCAIPEQDPKAPTVTKLTVMMGGHYYDDNNIDMENMSDEEILSQAQNLVQSHLDITAAPIHALVRLQKNCIPQYYVGHYGRMKQLHEAIKSNERYAGKLSVTGASYWGVSVNDCVLNARKLVENLLSNDFKDKETMGGTRKIITGLERVEEEENISF